MTTYYVATRGAYVLVDAESEMEARDQGRRLLQDIYAKRRQPLEGPVPIEIRIVRPATQDEIELVAFHDAKVASKRAMESR